MKLNLGSGGRKFDGWTNIDAQPMEEPDIVCDLSTETWPFEDNSVDEMTASHVMEHIGAGFFHFMKEMYRVGKPGALIHVITPHPRHDVFLNDPTHVRVVTPDLLALFSKRFHFEQLKKGAQYTPFWKYNDVDFEIVGPIQMVLDERMRGRDDWRQLEQHWFNVVAEMRFDMKVIK